MQYSSLRRFYNARKKVYQILFCLQFCLLWATLVQGQTSRESVEEQIESTIEDEITSGQIQSFDLIADLLPHSINLNGDQVEILVEIQLLTPVHIQALNIYKAANGLLISIYELQAVPHFDIATIRKILPYISVHTNSNEFTLTLRKRLNQGSSELILRWGQLIERQPAFNPASSITRFYGNKSRLYFRYRYQVPGKIYFGLTGEKDPGEEFFRGTNPYGFDFYSYHLFIKEYKSWLPIIAIGDYSITLGHGLIINSGFTLGKSALTTRLINARRTLRPYTSVGEYSFMRGIAFKLKLHKHLSSTFFYSRKKNDASVRIDTIFDDNSIVQIDKLFSSLQSSGNHRSASELNNRKQVRQVTTGGSLEFRKQNFGISLNLVHRSFNKTLSPKGAISNLNRFSGKRLTNVSVSYHYSRQNLYFFGETATSQNGIFSSVNGFLLALDKKIDIAVLARFIPPAYQQFDARTFGESSTAENESGIYIGTEIRPHENWTINAYMDTWKHTRPRFGVNGAGQGNEQLLRITYHKRHHSTFYIQYRHEAKDRNSTLDDLRIDQVVRHSRQYLRMHFSHKVGGGIELRNRIEFSFYNEEYQESKKGVLIYQDVIFKPIESRFTFTARIAFFDTDDYLSRIYAYENDLSYQFSVPAYTYRGVRYYLNLKYSGIRNITIEGRIAQLRLYDRDEIGSGNLMIDGNTKTEVKVQVRMRF
jgi:hypothetical protein